jgi:ABC-type sugar transport system permease subunit
MTDNLFRLLLVVSTVVFSLSFFVWADTRGERSKENPSTIYSNSYDDAFEYASQKRAAAISWYIMVASSLFMLCSLWFINWH